MTSFMLLAAIVLAFNTALFTLAVVVAQHYDWLPKNRNLKTSRKSSVLIISGSRAIAFSKWAELSARDVSIYEFTKKSNQNEAGTISIPSARAEQTSSATLYWPELPQQVVAA